MAQQTTETTGGYTQGNKRSEKKADAWGNIKLLLKDGETVNFSTGINPIYEENGQLHRSLINAAIANGGEIELNAKFIVRIAPKDDGTDLKFK